MVELFAFDVSDEIRLVSNDFPYTFKKASLATTEASEIELIELVGRLSKIKRVLSSTSIDSLSYFDEADESQTDDMFQIST